MNPRRPESAFSGDDRSPTDDVERFVADARVSDAVVARRRERWMRSHFAESATVRSLLVAAIDHPVEIGLSSGDTVPGRPCWVGSDCFELSTRSGPCWITTGAVVSVTSSSSLPAGEDVEDAAGADADRSGLVEVLVDLVDDRARVELVVTGGGVARGEITAAGSVVTIDPGDRGAMIYIATDAIVSARKL